LARERIQLTMMDPAARWRIGRWSLK
jgi:hypothetical protein